MKRKIILSLIFLLMISGCSSLQEESNTKFESKSNFSSTQIVHTELVSQTPLPTTEPLVLSNDKARETFLELLLNNGNCRLPCFWGITPGESSKEVAINILSPLVNISDQYGYDFSSNDGYIDLNYSDSDNITLETTIEYFSENDVISQISVQISEGKDFITSAGDHGSIDIFDSNTFTNHIHPYTLTSMLSTYGKPEAVLIQTFNSESSLGKNIIGGFDILLLYPSKGMLVHYETQMKVRNNFVYGCPKDSHVELKLFPSGKKDSFAHYLSKTEWSGFWPLPIKKPYWIPIQDATNMTLDQFYKTFIVSSDNCIETPTKLWVEPFR